MLQGEHECQEYEGNNMRQTEQPGRVQRMGCGLCEPVQGGQVVEHRVMDQRGQERTEDRGDRGQKGHGIKGAVRTGEGAKGGGEKRA
jgi:hypothetical protein